MSDDLVNRIAEQVLAALKAQGTAPPPAAPAGADADAAPLAIPASAAPAPMAKPGAPPKVFVTAEMLGQRLAVDDGDGRAIELAPHEFLTPAAADLADERHVAVRKPAPSLPKAPAPASASVGGNPGQAAATDTPGAVVAPAAPGGDGARTCGLGLVVERPSDTVRSVLAALARDGLAVADYSQTDCWIVNTQLLCKAIAGGTVPAGVVVLPYAADAMVLAGKVRGIRAVQGTRVDSVAAALRHFAANLLVLEHAFSTYHEMRTMVRLFAGERPARPAAEVLVDAVAKLERT